MPRPLQPLRPVRLASGMTKYTLAVVSFHTETGYFKTQNAVVSTEILLNWHIFSQFTSRGCENYIKICYFEVLVAVLIKVQINVVYSYHTHTTYMFRHSFISHICGRFRQAISATLKGKTHITKEEVSPLKIVHIFAMSPDDRINCLSKHVAYMRNKLMSEQLC
jgi:hypothetical protein